MRIQADEFFGEDVTVDPAYKSVMILPRTCTTAFVDDINGALSVPIRFH